MSETQQLCEQPLILPENVVAQKLKQPTHAFADDGGAQVTHVHLFGNVGRGEIHHHLSNEAPHTLYTILRTGGHMYFKAPLLRILNCFCFDAFQW